MDSEKVKIFLTRKLDECKDEIRKYKKTKTIIKAINIGLVTITIVGPCVVSAATPFTATIIPMFIVNGISTTAGTTAMLSWRFNLKERK